MMKLRNRTLGLIAALAMGIGASSIGNAALIIDLPSNVNPPVNGHIPGASNPGAGDIAAALGITTTQLGPLLYKINNNGSEDGSLQTSYSTANAGPVSFTAEPIVISYGSGNYANATYLLVKDGNLGSFIFNIGPSGLNWNGTDDIQVFNLFDPEKNLTGTSHVEFYGTATPVPEPGTMIAGALLLLPFAASTVRFVRKKK